MKSIRHWIIPLALATSLIANVFLLLDRAITKYYIHSTENLTKQFVVWADEAEKADIDEISDYVKCFAMTVHHVGSPLADVVETSKLREYTRVADRYQALKGHRPDSNDFKWLQGPRPPGFEKAEQGAAANP